jgi:hypothetical protein
VSTLEQQMVEYLTVRRALGFKLANVERLLRQFVRYLDQRGEQRITITTALAWAIGRPVGRGYWGRLAGPSTVGGRNKATYSQREQTLMPTGTPRPTRFSSSSGRPSVAAGRTYHSGGPSIRLSSPSWQIGQVALTRLSLSFRSVSYIGGS